NSKDVEQAYVSQIKRLTLGLVSPIMRPNFLRRPPRTNEMHRDAQTLQGSAFPPKKNVSLSGKFWNEVSDPQRVNHRANVLVFPYYKREACSTTLAPRISGCRDHEEHSNA